MKMFSENAQNVIKFLQSHSGDYTAIAMADALDVKPSTINGIVTSLTNKGICYREEVEGIEKKVIRLTAEGHSVDPNAEKPE